MALSKRYGKSTYIASFRYRKIRVSRDTGCRSKKGAERWIKEKKRQIDEEYEALQRERGRRMTLEDAAARYWDERLQFANKSNRSEKYRLAKVIVALGPETLLTRLTTADVTKYVASQQSEGLQPGTINRELNTIRALVNHAVEMWEYPLKAIAWKRLRLKDPKKVFPQITMAQGHRLIEAATERLANCIRFALLTGLRRTEIEELLWENVNLAERWYTLTGKGGKEAMLPLSSPAVELLALMQARSSQRRIKPTTVFDMTNFVREWNAARRAAGLPIGRRGFRFHDLRHTFATWLEECGAPIGDIITGLRHEDAKSSRGYIHADNRKLLPYLERLAEKFGNAGDSSVAVQQIDGSGGADDQPPEESIRPAAFGGQTSLSSWTACRVSVRLGYVNGHGDDGAR